MITYKTFTTNPIGLTSRKTQSNREKLREKVEEFLNHEMNSDDVTNIDVINITETISLGMPFSITVWYRLETEQ